MKGRLCNIMSRPFLFFLRKRFTRPPTGARMRSPLLSPCDQIALPSFVLSLFSSVSQNSVVDRAVPPPCRVQTGSLLPGCDVKTAMTDENGFRRELFSFPSPLPQFFDYSSAKLLSQPNFRIFSHSTEQKEEEERRKEKGERRKEGREGIWRD